ncbi:MAG: hypothetical protein GXO60_09115 [Epsilonproteobacteria bacterium]|nr:hypothetical protein [Campylobacterota bacterium]
MCDKKTWIEIISNSNIWEDARKYLLNNKSSFEKKINDIILTCNDYASNNRLELQKEDFVLSIIDGHFNWIIDDLENPEEIEFNSSKYDEETIYELYSSYCCVYKELSVYINTLHLDKKIKEIFIDYFNAFAEDYCI